MRQYNPSNARRLARNIRTTHSAVDMALLEMTRLTGNMLEMGVEAEVPVIEGQKALEAVSHGFATFVAGRRDIARAQRELAAMKARSNLDIVDLGCVPGPLTGQHLRAVE